MSDKHTTNWPDLAIGLYDRLTGMNAEISYQFEEHAEWVLNGKVKISTQNRDDSPN
jgi:hypothetical protein